jgi:glycosyltransferase involved in cell wall biosynthesis
MTLSFWMQLVSVQLSTFQIITLVICMNYVILIGAFIIGLSRLFKGSRVTASSEDKSVDKNAMVSVIIAARNEADSIGKCINSLKRQDYLKEQFEVIIINDQSTDSTADIINQYINEGDINLILLNTSGKVGKKAAVTEGIKQAKGEIILTTDADCEVSSGWISSFCGRFKSTGAYYITGPVMFYKGRGFFNQVQCLEFNSLIASTAGAIGIGMPVMSNGASMGVLKKTVTDMVSAKKPGDDLLRNNFESGDDVFLLQSIKSKYSSSKIAFLDDPTATVYTHSTGSLGEFLHQRLRWVSKSKGYSDTGVIYTSLSIFFFNLIILLSIFSNLILTSFLFIMKCAIDYLLISKYDRKYGQRELNWLIPIAEPLIIIYTVLIGVIGNFAPYKWKGRKIKTFKTSIPIEPPAP